MGKKGKKGEKDCGSGQSASPVLGGASPAELQQLASLNTGDMEIDSFMGSLLGGPSSMLNSDDDEEDEDEIVPNEPIDSFVTESSSRRRSTTTATATTTTTTSNPHE